jgi:hypothetical protein
LPQHAPDSFGDANATLATGDPVFDTTVTTGVGLTEDYE